MDFDSPDVMEDFPGLYKAEKRKGNDSDYNEENEKSSKKEMIIGKRKEKKDKKDKEKGYAALEGESSDEASPCKAKKSKAFIFTKSKDKEKEHVKDKGECNSKPRNKKKVILGFTNRFGQDATNQNIADALPIFGTDLKSACLRGKCHDGILIPFPVRECIDYLEEKGLNFENIYKTTGHRSKVSQIKKMYNNRQTVILSKYDVPIVTSVLKTFLRDLPEPIFTLDLLVRFEEAGAIFNYHTREKHLKSLINSLPEENRILLSYLIMHFHNIVQRDQVNKMNKQNLAQALNHTLHISSRLLKALITHRIDLYPDGQIIKYIPPLDGTSTYPDNPVQIKEELDKLESALNLMHWEMQQGFCSSWRQDQLWEVQRIQTELKRKLKKEMHQSQLTVEIEEPGEDHTTGDIQEDAAEESEDLEEEIHNKIVNNISDVIKSSTNNEEEEPFYDEPERQETESECESDNSTELHEENACLVIAQAEETYIVSSEENPSIKENLKLISKITPLQLKNQLMIDLIQNLNKNIANERKEIEVYQKQLENLSITTTTTSSTTNQTKREKIPRNLSKVRNLLYSENRMLEIKKLELVRKIVENQEQCMDLRTKIITLESQYNNLRSITL